MCWLDDTLKAEHKAEKFSVCLPRRNLRPSQTANVHDFDMTGRDPWKYAEVFYALQLDALFAVLFMHFLPSLPVNWGYQELTEMTRSKPYHQSRQLG